jgi:hypothetical protein
MSTGTALTSFPHVAIAELQAQEKAQQTIQSFDGLTWASKLKTGVSSIIVGGLLLEKKKKMDSRMVLYISYDHLKTP